MKGEEDKITRAQKITILVTIGVVFLGIILQLLVKTWYSPDIRYECGTYYKFKDQSVVSCKLKNYGHKTASLIRVFAKFKSNILDVQISPFTKYNILKGNVGEKDLVIELERIVPDTQATIFYGIQNSQEEPFIEKIEYEDYIGRTGRPILWSILPVIILYIVTPLMLRRILKSRIFNKDIDKFYKNIEEVVEMVSRLKKDNASEQELEAEFESRFKNVSFRKESLKRIAKAVFCKNLE